MLYLIVVREEEGVEIIVNPEVIEKDLEANQINDVKCNRADLEVENTIVGKKGDEKLNQINIQKQHMIQQQVIILIS